MDVIKMIIDDAIASLQLPNNNYNNVFRYTPVVIQTIMKHLSEKGYPYVANAQIKDCNNRPYTTFKIVLLVATARVDRHYIITFHVKAKTIWKVTCKLSGYNEVMDIAYDNGYVQERYMIDNELETKLKMQLRRIPSWKNLRYHNN